MLHYSFGEEILLEIQSEPPLAQLKVITSHPIACYLREKINLPFLIIVLTLDAKVVWKSVFMVVLNSCFLSFASAFFLYH